MLLAPTFVPEADVLTSFAELYQECLAELHSVYDEFKEFIITGKPARGHHLAIRPRYPIYTARQKSTCTSKN